MYVLNCLIIYFMVFLTFIKIKKYIIKYVFIYLNIVGLQR